MYEPELEFDLLPASVIAQSLKPDLPKLTKGKAKVLDQMRKMTDGRLCLVTGEPGSGKTRLVKTLVANEGCTVLFDPYSDFTSFSPNPKVEVFEEAGYGIDLSSTKREDMDQKYEIFTKLTQQRHRGVTFYLISQTPEIYERFNALDKLTIHCRRVPRALWMNFIGTKVTVKGFGQRRIFFVKSNLLLGSN